MGKTVTIDYKCKGYKLVFNLNVMQAIQEEYGTFEKWSNLASGEDGEINIKALVYGLTQMINEAIDIDNDDNGTNEPFLLEKKVSRIVSEYGLEKTTQAMSDVVTDATKDDSEKNA